MIIRKTEQDSVLAGVSYKKDKVVFHHVQPVENVLKKAHELRESSDNGFSKDRQFRQIAEVPELLVVKHPEWLSEPHLFRKWLYSEEGRQYRTVKGGI